MPISSGGSGGGGAGSLTLLSTTTRATDGTFDVSGIAGTYNDLVAVLVVRSVRAVVLENPAMLINNDSGANYYREQMLVSAATGTASEALGIAAADPGRIPAANATAGSFGVVEITFPGYASTTWKKAYSWQSFGWGSTASADSVALVGGGLWNSSAAITRLTFTNAAAGNFLTGSQLRIYGRL